MAVEGDPLVAKSLDLFASHVKPIESAEEAAKLAIEDARRESRSGRNEGGPPVNRPTIGAIDTAKPGKVKGTVDLTFKTNTRIRDLDVCDKPKFDHWSGDPPVAVYIPVCYYTGRKKTEHITPKAVTIVAGCTAGLEHGRYIELNSDGKDGQASVNYVYADDSKDAKVIAEGCLPVQ